MDASAALMELLGLSTQVVEAVITGPAGTIEAAHAASEDRSRELWRSTAAALVSEAETIRAGSPVARIHVDLERGSLVVARDEERDDRRDDGARADSGPRRVRPANGAPARSRGGGMRLLVLVALLAGRWFVLRRRGGDDRRVVVAWEDGSELELRRGSPEREALTAIAHEALP